MTIKARILTLIVAGAFGLVALPNDTLISPAQACCVSFSPAPAPVYRAPSPTVPLARPPAIVVRPPVHQFTAHLFTPVSNRIFLSPGGRWNGTTRNPPKLLLEAPEIAEQFVEIEQQDDYLLEPYDDKVAGDLQPPPVVDPWGDF